MRPSRASLAQLGRSPLAASGATIPNPSVALCKANPTTSRTARGSSPAAAELPMARPSAKLWSPMPMAIIRASWAAGDEFGRNAALVPVAPAVLADSAKTGSRLVPAIAGSSSWCARGRRRAIALS